MTDIAVLGCGPSGLMAAHAASQMGANVTVYSRKRQSEMFGAQYLHEHIPGVAELSAPRRITYELVGTADAYRRKVYGPDWNGDVSPEEYTHPHLAYDIRQAYNELWRRYKGIVVDTEITPMWIKAIKADYVFNTIPLNQLCDGGHSFQFASIWAMGDAPARGQHVPFDIKPNSVMCNGEDSPSWYRVSNIFDHKTVEWPAAIHPPLPVAAVVKPLSNNCSCWPNVIRLGRYGAWRKGLLTHDSYFTAMDVLHGRIDQNTLRPHKPSCVWSDSGVTMETKRMVGCSC